ncbi:MAG: hypothetical protein WC816_01025 [Sphingomonas sp.]
MSTQIVEPSAAGPPDLAGLEPLTELKSRWPAIFGGVLTIAMVVGVVRALFGKGLAGLALAVPDDPLFYVFFALLYLSEPLGDYVIFRRLWRIPLGGLVALLKKRIANELVLGYSGEAYFYTWARQRAPMVAAPFGAVKDVSILSAMAGNALTLVLIALALPVGHGLLNHDEFVRLAGSMLIVIAMSLPFLIFSKRVFSLARSVLLWIFGVHVVRSVAGAILLALTWHFGMPDVSIGMWLILSAGRQLASRLPLVPNKDLVFANFAILLIGQGEALTNLVAVTAALTIVVHVVLVCVFSVFGVIEVLRKR